MVSVIAMVTIRVSFRVRVRVQVGINITNSATTPLFCIPYPKHICNPVNLTDTQPLSLSLSLHFNGHFPGEPGLASVY